MTITSSYNEKHCHFSPIVWRKSIACLAILIFIAFSTPLYAVEEPSPQQLVGGNGNPAEITPAHVYQHVTRARRELDLIRREMGIGKVGVSHIRVKKAAPREVLYHALTLFRKANRFSFEQIRIEDEEPHIPTGNISPHHVLEMVNFSLDLILNIKSNLGIKEVIQEPRFDSQITPSDVFLNLLYINRQLNRMLEKSFAPKDVYQRVSLAIGYSAKLLAQFPDAERIPQAEVLERKSTPSDVFKRLANCYVIVRAIGQRSGLEMLEMDISKIKDNLIVPSEVYDIASLLISELAYLHAQLDDAALPRETHNPGRKFPSHVYQRVGILETQLQTLSERIDLTPNWLSAADGR